MFLRTVGKSLISILALRQIHLAVGVTVPIAVGENDLPEFNPANITITTSDDVLWHWTGALPHSIAQDSSPGACQRATNPARGSLGELFDSAQQQGEAGSFRMTFPEAGQYPYFSTVEGQCKQGMWGVITVIPVINAAGTVAETPAGAHPSTEVRAEQVPGEGHPAQGATPPAADGAPAAVGGPPGGGFFGPGHGAGAPPGAPEGFFPGPMAAPAAAGGDGDGAAAGHPVFGAGFPGFGGPAGPGSPAAPGPAGPPAAAGGPEPEAPHAAADGPAPAGPGAGAGAFPFGAGFPGHAGDGPGAAGALPRFGAAFPDGLGIPGGLFDGGGGGGNDDAE